MLLDAWLLLSCAGPLVVHVAKLFPKNDASSFDAYGRIFSGTLRPGDEVRGLRLQHACVDDGNRYLQPELGAAEQLQPCAAQAHAVCRFCQCAFG